MNDKRFYADIFLNKTNAVKSIGNREVLEESPLRLANDYVDNGADGIIIFNLCSDENDFEASLNIIKSICAEISVPVICAGAIKDIYSIGKLLDAGADKVVLNFALESNIALTGEALSKFGKDNLAVSVTKTAQYDEYIDIISDSFSEILIMQEEVTKSLLNNCVLPIIIPLSDIPLDRLMDYLDKNVVSGIFGTVVNANISQLSGIKSICRERGINVMTPVAAISWDELKKNSDGLVPCIVQDYRNNQVLMMAYMNREAFDATVETGKMNYYSRSRKSQWLKGETSGHFQYVKALYTDCDNDTLLAFVSQVGAACHTGSRSCFFNEIFNKL